MRKSTANTLRIEGLRASSRVGRSLSREYPPARNHFVPQIEDEFLPSKGRVSCRDGARSTVGQTSYRYLRGGNRSGLNEGTKCRYFARASTEAPRPTAACAARDSSFSESGSCAWIAPKRRARFRKYCSAITAPPRACRRTRKATSWFRNGTGPSLFPARQSQATCPPGLCDIFCR